MGKSFELMGLVTFNIFIAMVISATMFSNGDKINTLTRENLSSFINNMAEITSGTKEDIDDYTIVSFLQDHLHEDGTFKSTIDYQDDSLTSNTRSIEMGKSEFIGHTIQGLKTMEKHESAVKIDDIRIENAGRTATVYTTNYERGVMPVDDGFGGMQMMPVYGTSYCEQNFSVSANKTIQLTSATCSTDLSFDQVY